MLALLRSVARHVRAACRGPTPCGVTAAAMEATLAFPAHGVAHVPRDRLCMGTVLRVHVELCSDAGCFDHVLFVAATGCAQTYAVLDSYAGVRGATVATVSAPQWHRRMRLLADATSADALAAAWHAAFGAPVPVAGTEVALDIHVATADTTTGTFCTA